MRVLLKQIQQTHYPVNKIVNFSLRVLLKQIQQTLPSSKRKAIEAFEGIAKTNTTNTGENGGGDLHSLRVLLKQIQQTRVNNSLFVEVV